MRTVLMLALALWLWPLAAAAVNVPEEGDCPPYPVGTTDAPADEDVVPPLFRPGDEIALDRMRQLTGYLPPEIWALRLVFFYEGMRLEIGPCHRRYPAPPYFDEATKHNQGEVELDDEGNLRAYSGAGLPFDWHAIDDAAPDAALKWAWNMRYRYQGSGFRGDFRILNVARRGQKIDRFTGRFYLLPMQGVPDVERDANGARFWAGGSFKSPPVARGLAWRQLRPIESDWKKNRSDEIFVWLPDERKVKRVPPMAVEGVYTPSYTRGNDPGMNRAILPNGTEIAGASLAAAEHTRVGFGGLLMQPNRYTWKFVEVRDVLAPINASGHGYPSDTDRSYGPSGQSLGTDRWDLRRAVVIRGEKKDRDDNIFSATYYIDALTQQPLYLISRRRNGHLVEVGSFVGRFSGDDSVHTEWKGGNRNYGAILPIAATFYTGRGTGWLRESFELRFDPPNKDEANDYTTTIKLQRGR